jgi:hypothetical protein
MSKHTPGKWVVNPEPAISEGEDCNAFSVKFEGDNAPTYEENYANARLMAAAPDLLDALESAVKHLKGNQQVPSIKRAYETALAAISKARGTL